MVGQSHCSSHPVCVAWLIRVAAAIVCLNVHGCTSVHGGAVELSWKLRAASGAQDNFVNCDASGALTDSMGRPYLNTGAITAIRLHWDIDGMESFADFQCSANHGVTGFQLPPGEAFLWVSPVCATGDAADRMPPAFSAPAPVQRTVISGNTISLGAVELVLEVASCTDQPCICQ